MKPKVLIADDHQLFTEGLRSVLESSFRVIGTASDGRELVELAERLRPDVVITDITMPGLNGIEAVRRIKQGNPRIQAVLLTMHVDPMYAEEAFTAGASAYVLKHTPGSELIQAIRDALSGRSYISPLLDGYTLEKLRRAEHRSGTALSPRQREVLQLLAEGRSSKEIADVIGISARTVEFHKAVVMSKLGAHSSSDLIRYALKRGLVA